MHTQTHASSTKTIELLLVNDHARFVDGRSRGVAVETETAAVALLLRGIFMAADFSPAIDVVLVGQVRVRVLFVLVLSNSRSFD
jgi:hypothetical protein